MGTPYLTPEDLLRISVLEEVALSPDTLHVATTVRRSDPEANRTFTSIQFIPLRGHAEPAWTSGDWNDSAPSWSPDGSRLAFLSDREGTAQVWVRGSNGKARRLTSFPGGVRGQAQWSPDGRQLLVVVLDEMEVGPPATVRPDTPPFVLRRSTYRVDGLGYLGSRYHHLWLVDVETGEVTQLTGERCDDLDPAWSPDGQHIAFISNRADERLIDFRSAVWVLAVAGGEARRITPDDGLALSPTWSPDAREIAYAGLPSNMAPGCNHQLLLAPATGDSPPHSLTEGYEGHIGGALFCDVWSPGKLHPRLRWTPDGTRIRCVAACRGTVNVVEVDRTSQVRTLIGGDRACGLLDVSPDGEMLAYAAADATHPPYLYVKKMPGDEESYGGSSNQWLDALPLACPQHLTVTGADGPPVDAWLLTPSCQTDLVPGPLVLYVHGGPHSIFGQVFFFDMQLLVAHGYRVLFANPRATRGYGDAFATCNIGRWGEGDTPDQLAALDAAIATGWVDPGRIGVMGLSYGGYMTNWLIGHSDRFRAAISENSISNLTSFYGTSDIGSYFTVEEIGAEPLQDPERYARLSPLTAVESITTPLLLLNCLADWRCPVEQGEQLYAALKRRGRKVEMVCFPDESHSMLTNGKPRSRLVRRQHILRWFETHLC